MSQPDTSGSQVAAVAPTARQPDVSSRKNRWAAGNDSDRTLIAAIAGHDQAAFRKLHLRYDPRIARFVSNRFPRCTSAEEIISDTLWIVWRTAAQFKGASEVSTWIMGIAYRVGLRSLRNSERRFTDREQLEGAREASHNPSSARDIRDWVAVGLARLPDEQRKVLELAYHLGHSCAEIALTMNCPVGTVKTRMHHGRQKLKYMLPSLAGLSRNGVTAGNAKRVRVLSPR
jgi:RNA polymerase sigma-70 factor (ECF subfamily)